MTGDDALHRIDTHEKVCSERHGYIMDSLKDLRSEDSELKAEIKATRGTIRQEIENVEIGLRREFREKHRDHDKRLTDIEKSLAKWGGVVAVLLFLATLGGSILGSYLK